MSWTWDDRQRLFLQAIRAGDRALVDRIVYSDAFEPSLGCGGLSDLLDLSPEERRTERERVRDLILEREKIKAGWNESADQKV